MAVKINLQAIKQNGRYICKNINCENCKLHNVRDDDGVYIITYCGYKIRHGTSSHGFTLKKYVLRSTKVCNNCKRVNIE